MDPDKPTPTPRFPRLTDFGLLLLALGAVLRATCVILTTNLMYHLTNLGIRAYIHHGCTWDPLVTIPARAQVRWRLRERARLNRVQQILDKHDALVRAGLVPDHRAPLP